MRKMPPTSVTGQKKALHPIKQAMRQRTSTKYYSIQSTFINQLKIIFSKTTGFFKPSHLKPNTQASHRRVATLAMLL